MAAARLSNLSLSLSLDDDDDEENDEDEDDDQTKMLQVCQISPEIIKRNFTLYLPNQFAIRLYLKTNPHWMGVL